MLKYEYQIWSIRFFEEHLFVDLSICYGKQTGHKRMFKQCCIFIDSAIVGAGRNGEYDF